MCCPRPTRGPSLKAVEIVLVNEILMAGSDCSQASFSDELAHAQRTDPQMLSCLPCGQKSTHAP